MQYRQSFASLVLFGALLVGCDDRSSNPLVYLSGRAVEHVGDTVFAATSDAADALLVLRLESDRVDTIGLGELDSPFHVQFHDDHWYVSDVSDGAPAVVRFTLDGRLVERVDLSPVTATPHQFAVLPDGGIVVETPNSELVVLRGDSSTTFALAEAGNRPSLLVALGGGVLHAVPDEHITLYNGFGNIRWRREWEWTSAAFVSDIAIDAKGRVHYILGVPGEEEGVFRIYSMVATTGEIERWSEAGKQATFVVGPFGAVRPDSASRWFGPVP